MKKLYSILLLLFLLTSCFPDTLSEIGELELLMSEKEFKELVGEENLTIVEYPFGTTAESKLEGKDVKAFHLKKYVSKDGMILEDITVSFTLDRLYCINVETYNPKLEKQLKEKFKIAEREYDGQNYIEKLRWETNSEDIVCRSLRHTHPLATDPIYHFFLVSNIGMVYINSLK